MLHINIVSASMTSILLSMLYFTASATVSSAIPDAVSSTKIALPAGSYATLHLLGGVSHGNPENQRFVVTCAYGAKTTVAQSLADCWGPPQNYAGESQALKLTPVVTTTEAALNEVVYVYGYRLTIDSAKALPLPNNRHLVPLATDVSAEGATPLQVNLTAFDNLVGIVENGTGAARGGGHNSGYAYSENLHGTSITNGDFAFAPDAQGSTAAQTLQIAGSPAITTEVGQFYSFRPTVMAPAGSSLTYAVANKPAWAQFSAATGSLSGTPSTASVATDVQIVVSVSNGARSASLPAFNINVLPALAGAASLSWSRPTGNSDGTPLTNLAGYVIRYGTSSTSLNHRISVASASTTGAEITSLSPGNWYFEVAAFNTANVKSKFSPIVVKTIL